MPGMQSAVPDTKHSRLIYSVAASYVTDVIRAMAGSLTPEHIAGLVERDASFWYDCVPEKTRAMLREQSKPLADAARDVPYEVIRDWILDARPDFVGPLGDEDGEVWLVRTIAEIKDDLWP